MTEKIGFLRANYKKIRKRIREFEEKIVKNNRKQKNKMKKNKTNWDRLKRNERDWKKLKDWKKRMGTRDGKENTENYRRKIIKEKRELERE